MAAAGSDAVPLRRTRPLNSAADGGGGGHIEGPRPPPGPRPAGAAQRPGHRHATASKHGSNNQSSTGRRPSEAKASEGLPTVVFPKSGKALRRLTDAALGSGEFDTEEAEARRLKENRRLRDKDASTKELMVRGMKANRFCKLLDQAQLEALFDIAEYYRFGAGDVVCRQGDLGHYFFVVHHGDLEVRVNDQQTNTLGRGDAFGAIALLYHCPRTATVVSTSESGLWGMERRAFQTTMQEYGQKHLAENLRFLETVRLFDGLSAKQKARLCESAMCIEAFEANARIITRGEEANGMYFVKKGELSMMSGGVVNSSGFLVDGTKVSQLLAGDSFGWRAMLYGEPHPMTVVADQYCEMVCLTWDDLKGVIGPNVVTFLEQSFIHHILRQLPFAGKLPISQRHRLVKAMEVKRYEAGQRVDEVFGMIAVIDGEVSGQRGSDDITLHRGEVCTPDGTLVSLLEPRSGTLDPRLPTNLRAGPEGCRLAVLRKSALAKTFKEFGLLEIGSAEQTVGNLQLMLLMRKVPIFRDLADSQLESLVTKLVLRKYVKGAKVFVEGEAGNNFFVIWSGTVQILSGGKFVRNLGKGTCFGERALIFEDDLRSATVEVTSSEAEIWSLDRQSFRTALNPTMLKIVQQRIKLQDRGVTLKSLRHVRVVGSGTFGSVRLVEQMEQRSRYVLKRIRKNGTDVPKQVLREVEVLNLMAETEESFVLRLVRTFDTDRSFYLLMEPISGGSLHSILPRLGGMLDQAALQFYAGCAVLALEALHERDVVHRNICPDNLMIDGQGFLKVANFAHAKRLEQHRTYTLAGAPAYMAPEVIRGRGYGTEADIWSLGVTCFELATGELPFDGPGDIFVAVLDTDPAFPPSYHDEVAKVMISKLLQKEPLLRLGNQMLGWEDVKNDLFFLTHESGDFFGCLVERKLTPPFTPGRDMWPAETEFGKVSLSDAEELGAEKDQMVRIRAVFRKFDLNGDGTISNAELRKVLKRLDYKTYTDDVIDMVVNSIDANGDGDIDYEEFISWILSADGEGMRRATHLDVHE